MRGRGEVATYNASIKSSKEALDMKNQEIAEYKATVESLSGFDSTLCLEYLQPYLYKIEPMKRYVRRNTDTLPVSKIDSVGQIEDKILRKVIASIDSMAGIDVDDAFVKEYNSLVDRENPRVNRTELIKLAYDRINDDVATRNNELKPGVCVMESYSDDLLKHDVYTQGRKRVTVQYTDSVKEVLMTENEKIEWRNRIKKKVWEELQRRRHGEYIRRAPKYLLPADTMVVETDSISVVSDSISAMPNSMSVKPDSVLAVPDSTMAVPDSMITTPVVSVPDSMGVDTLSVVEIQSSDTVIVNVDGRDEWLSQDGYASTGSVKSANNYRKRREDEE